MSIKAIALLVLLVAVVSEAYPRLLVIDDGELEDFLVSDGELKATEQVRVVRDDKKVSASAPSPSRNTGGNRGRVGPVYTFVRTDPKANFKWGVRHRVGSQYGR